MEENITLRRKAHATRQSPFLARPYLAYYTSIELGQFASHAELRLVHRQRIIEALQHEESEFRDPGWSESVAVGQLEYVEAIHKELGCRSRGRTCTELEHGFQLKEAACLYTVYQH